MPPAAWISRALHPQGTITGIIIRPWRNSHTYLMCEREGRKGRRGRVEREAAAVTDGSIMSEAFWG